MFDTAKLYLYAGIAIVAIGAFWYVKHLQNKVDDLTTQNVVISAQLTLQNKAVDDWKDAANKRWVDAAKALKDAKVVADGLFQQAGDIYKTKGSGCDDALQLLNTTP